MGGAPSQWMVYFAIDDVDAAFRRAIDMRSGDQRATVVPRWHIRDRDRSARRGIRTAQAGASSELTPEPTGPTGWREAGRGYPGSAGAASTFSVCWSIRLA